MEKFRAVKMQNEEKHLENGSKVNNSNHHNDIKEEKKEFEPPKPMPRKSISEQSSFEEIPKPKPRTSNNFCNNYKVHKCGTFHSSAFLFYVQYDHDFFVLVSLII